MALLSLPTNLPSGYIPTITEWNSAYFGAINTRVNDITYDQVSTSLIDTAVSANSTTKVPRTDAVKSYVDAQINNLQVTQENYRIISGNSDIWGTPEFIVSGSGNDVSIVSGLTVFINGTVLTLSATQVVSGLTLASAGVSATISAGIYAGSAFTRTEGEFGDTVIVMDGYASAFTATNRIDTQQAFKTGSEFFLGKVSKKSTAAEIGIEKCKRGIGRSARGTLTDNDVVYLMESNYLFLNSDGSVSATTLPPKYQATDPGSGTSGEYYFNTNSKVWKRYTGSWAQQNAIPLGVVVLDSVGVVAIDHEDFDLSWDSTYEADIYPIMEGTSAISAVSGLSAIGVNIQKISVAGETVYMPQPRELVLSATLLSSLTEASGTLYYLYLTPLGEFYFDTVSPREKGKKKGYYHPKYYWRNISFWYNDSSYNMAPFKQSHIDYIYSMNGTGAGSDSVTSSTSTLMMLAVPTSPALFETKPIPPFIKWFNSTAYAQSQTNNSLQKSRLATFYTSLGSTDSNTQAGDFNVDLYVENQTVIMKTDRNTNYHRVNGFGVIW